MVNQQFDIQKQPQQCAGSSKDEIKKCGECKNEKSIDEFYKNKCKKSGLSDWCKECDSEYNKEYRQKNINKIKERNKEYYQCNSEKIKKRVKQWAKDNQLKVEKVHKKWIKNNLEYVRKYFREYQKNRRKNFVFRINHNISKAIWYSLKGGKKGKHWEDLIGYVFNDLKKHLEGLFQEGMTWENYGKWHVDHIQPIDSFNIISVESKAFKKCWALNNLQPLWAIDNMRKSNKLLWQLK